MPDYILREAALKEMLDKSSKHGFELQQQGKHMTRNEGEMFRRDYDVIKSLPAADVAEVVHARYIDTGNNCLYGHSRAVKCSNCGAIVGLMRSFKYKYCHACGAKMDGGKPNAR